jgi:alpha-L-arabinofuranosidase
MKRLGVDLVDEHYYQPPQFFYDNATRYDSYDRSGPKVFAGEYAAHLPGRENNFNTALSEAAFMTGLERNADVVHMATYAPLFAHRDAWQWAPDLIWFDNLAVVRTPNYYVQQMYGHNAGTHVLPLTVGGKPLTGQNRLYGTAALDRKANELIVKIVNADNQPRAVSFTLAGLARSVGTTGKAVVLQASDLLTENEFDRPEAIAPTEREIATGDTFDYTAAPQSFSVIRIALQ